MAAEGAGIGNDPDSSLVAAACAGDRDAFAALLERHYDRIHGLAWQLTGSRADADDIAQDVCCTLVEKIGSFRGEAKFTHLAVRHHLQRLPRPAAQAPLVRGFTEKLAVLAGPGRRARTAATCTTRSG